MAAVPSDDEVKKMDQAALLLAMAQIRDNMKAVTKSEAAARSEAEKANNAVKMARNELDNVKAREEAARHEAALQKARADEEERLAHDLAVEKRTREEMLAALKGIGVKTELESGGTEAAKGRTSLATRAALSLKPPELFKPGPNSDIEAWLERVSVYMAAAGLTDRDDRALVLVAGLSQEAFTAMHRLHLPEAIWQDPRAFSDELIRKFGEQKTAVAYAMDYRAAKQEAKEDAGAFFDRVKHLSRKAFPAIFEARDEAGQLQLVKQQFVEGLRSKDVRRGLVHSDDETLERLRASAVKFELAETVISGRASEQPASHLAVDSKASSSSENANASDKNGSGGKGKGKSGGNGAFKSSKPAAPGSSTGGTAQCQWCGKPGHTAAKCYRLRGRGTAPTAGASTGTGPSRKDTRTCFRCGRVGHVRTDCTATTRADGSTIPPASAPKPEAAGDAAASKHTEKPASHLNAGGDVHPRVARPLTSTMSW